MPHRLVLYLPATIVYAVSWAGGSLLDWIFSSSGLQIAGVCLAFVLRQIERQQVLSREIAKVDSEVSRLESERVTRDEHAGLASDIAEVARLEAARVGREEHDELVSEIAKLKSEIARLNGYTPAVRPGPVAETHA